jgi:hypothetical protein
MLETVKLSNTKPRSLVCPQKRNHPDDLHPISH